MMEEQYGNPAGRDDAALSDAAHAGENAMEEQYDNPAGTDDAVDHVIVTGHSRGLGAALARTWLDWGANVLGIARNGNPELVAAFPGQFDEKQLNLAETVRLQAWLESGKFRDFCRRGKRLWLFNNAGTAQPAARLGRQDGQAIRDAVNLNITAPLMLANAVAACARGEVNIVHISSGAATTAYSGWSIYCACKAALNQHARVALMEDTQTRVIALAPGVVDTDMQAQARSDSAFPMRGRFQKLFDNGELQSAEETAIKIVSYCLSEDFALDAVVDVRQLPDEY